MESNQNKKQHKIRKRPIRHIRQMKEELYNQRQQQQRHENADSMPRSTTACIKGTSRNEVWQKTEKGILEDRTIMLKGDTTILQPWEEPLRTEQTTPITYENQLSKQQSKRKRNQSDGNSCNGALQTNLFFVIDLRCCWLCEVFSYVFHLVHIPT